MSLWGRKDDEYLCGNLAWRPDHLFLAYLNRESDFLDCLPNYFQRSINPLSQVNKVSHVKNQKGKMAKNKRDDYTVPVAGLDFYGLGQANERRLRPRTRMRNPTTLKHTTVDVDCHPFSTLPSCSCPHVCRGSLDDPFLGSTRYSNPIQQGQGSVTGKNKDRENTKHCVGWLCNTAPPLSFLWIQTKVGHS
jgi:hypothetical protein